MQMDVPHGRGPERRGWHIDKTISVSDLVQIAVLAIPAFIWGSTVESRLAVSDDWRASVERQRSEDRAANDRAMTEVKDQLRRIDDKLEKIGDRVGARQ